MAELTNQYMELPKPAYRELWLTTQVDQESASNLSKAITDINNSDRFIEKIYNVYDINYTPKPIRINIDCRGGTVYSGFGILDLIDKSETPIHTFVHGCAMSMGFLIAISGHKRFCYPRSTYMYHQVSSGTIGPLAEMVTDVDEVKRLQQIGEETTVRKTRISLEKLREVYNTKTDWFITPHEALNLGCVDELL